MYSGLYFRQNKHKKGMKETVNIILANAPINNGNRGCVALSVTSMFIIDEIMSKAGVNYSLWLPDSQHNDCKIHEISINGKKIKYYDISYNKGFSLKDNAKIMMKSVILKKNFAKIFKQSDYILDIGQGDSFADIYGERRFNYIDRIHRIARKYKKRYCLLPQTIGPFEDESVKTKAIKSIEKADLCMARDKQSLDYVTKNVPRQKNVCECIDVAFFLPYETISQDKNYTHVGINISALLWNGGYTRNNQFGLKCDYQSLVRQLIEYFLNQDNVKVHLIPHVVSAERGIENDYAVSYDLWREYQNSNLLLAPFALDPMEIKSYIAGMDFFMGARMHSTIGAFSAGVPVVPMAYSRKFNGLFLETLSYNHLADMKAGDNDTIISFIKDEYENRGSLKKEIECQMETTVKEKKQLIMDKLKEFFNLR